MGNEKLGEIMILINNLFGDTTVTHDITKTDLEYLRDEIDISLKTLDI